jgi:hypothetical protein
VVVPLVRASAIGKISYAAFNPTFKIRGTAVALHPLEIVSVPVDQLGEILGSLSAESRSIVAALDELLTRDRTFPDFRLDITDVLTQGEWVVVRCKERGTHRGAGQLPVNASRYGPPPP